MSGVQGWRIEGTTTQGAVQHDCVALGAQGPALCQCVCGVCAVCGDLLSAGRRSRSHALLMLPQAVALLQ